MSPKEEDRRTQILNAAQVVFGRKSYDAATIKEVAQEAGVSPGLLYWYFKDKTDLFTSLLAERIGAAMLELRAEVSPELPPEEFLRRFAGFYIRLYERPQNLALFKMVITHTAGIPALVRQIQTQVIERVMGTVTGYFEGQRASGRMREIDAEMVTRTFIGSLMAYMVLKHIMQDPSTIALSPEKFIAGVADVLLRGILPCSEEAL
jgi:TetR/AcrR family transcriptional repressor of mexJK operon